MGRVEVARVEFAERPFSIGIIFIKLGRGSLETYDYRWD